MCRAFEETRAAAAYQKSIDVALRMIKDGAFPLEKIALYTGLPLEKVQELAGVKTA